MPSVASPYYDDPQMGQIAQNIYTAVVGDPERDAKMSYYGSEVQKNRASADKLAAETLLTRGRYGAQQEMTPELMARLAPLPGESAAAHAIRIAPLQSALARYGTGAADAANALHTNLQGVYAVDPTQEGKLAAMALHGTATNEDYAGTPEQARIVSQRKADQAYGVQRLQNVGSANVAGINAGSAANVARINLLKPENVAAGTTGYVAPGSPLYNDQNKGILPGLPTGPTVAGQAGATILSDLQQGKVTDPGYWRALNPSAYAQQTRAAAPGKGGKIDAAKLTAIENLALGNVQGAMDMSNPKKPILTADFINKVGPEKRILAQQAASDEFIANQNPASAARAYLDALGVAPGSTYSAPNVITRTFGSQGSITPAAGGEPAAPAAQPAAATPGAPVQVANEAQYNALPPNTPYVAPDGSVRRKGGTPAATNTQPVEPTPAVPSNAPVETEASYAKPTMFGGTLDAAPQTAAPVPVTAQVFTPKFASEDQAKKALGGKRDAEAREFLGLAPAAKGPEPLPNFAKMSPSEIVRFRDNPGTSAEAKRAAVAYLSHAPVPGKPTRPSAAPTQITSQKMADMVLANPRLYANMVEDAKAFNANRYGGR